MTTTTSDLLWPRIEQRFTELDDIREDGSLPIWQRAEAEARRAELARTWDLVVGESGPDDRHRAQPRWPAQGCARCGPYPARYQQEG